MTWNTEQIQNTDTSHPWEDGPVGACPHCGTVNEPFFTFCRNCIGKLPVHPDS